MSLLRRVLAAGAALALPLTVVGAVGLVPSDPDGGVRINQADGGVRINQLPITPRDREI